MKLLSNIFKRKSCQQTFQQENAFDTSFLLRKHSSSLTCLNRNIVRRLDRLSSLFFSKFLTFRYKKTISANREEWRYIFHVEDWNELGSHTSRDLRFHSRGNLSSHFSESPQNLISDYFLPQLFSCFANLFSSERNIVCIRWYGSWVDRKMVLNQIFVV